MKSRGMSVEVIDQVERVGDIAVTDEALRLSSHATVMRLFGASSDISAAYRALIPDRCRVDSSKLVPLRICREISRMPSSVAGPIISESDKSPWLSRPPRTSWRDWI
jgi:hypothetical protein